MTIDDLSERLASEGCNPLRYAIGARGAATDAHCLTTARRVLRELPVRDDGA